MSKSEALKFELEFLKIVFSSTLVALFGILSYGFINYKALSESEFLILSIAVLFSALILFVVLIKTKHKINELRKLKKGN